MADDKDKDPDDLDFELDINEEDDDFDFDGEGVVDPESVAFNLSPSQRVIAKVRALVPKLRNAIQGLLGAIKKSISQGLGRIKSAVSTLKKMEKKQLLQFFGAAAFFAVVLGAIWFIWFGGLFTAPKVHLVRSLYAEADFVKAMSEEKGLEAFYDSFRHTQYVFLMDKMTVNLKSQGSGGKLPMGIFEFFIEGTSREVLLEIKARRLEFKDYMQRVLEGFSYEEVQTKEGKAKMSVLLKEELNRHLMRGRVRAVFLKTFILKP